MPILDVDQAECDHRVSSARWGTGYAGMENELYFDAKTSMYFADAKKASGRADRRDQDPGRLAVTARTTSLRPRGPGALPGGPRSSLLSGTACASNVSVPSCAQRTTCP